MSQILKKCMTQAQHRYRHFVVLKRIERHFEIGDLVYLKLQPYKQNCRTSKTTFPNITDI